MDVEKLREDFPILKRKINGKDLVYFDNAATTQKPKQVINALKEFYENNNANIHRSIHTLGEEATQKYEEVRKNVALTYNCEYEEVIFTRNTTESLNLISYILEKEIKKDDLIVTSILEHHSNFLPWKRLNGNLKVLMLDENFEYDIEQYEKLLQDNPKVVALTHASNVTGTFNKHISKLFKKAKEVGAITVLDAAQSAPHYAIDFKSLNADFIAFSSHKMLGPTGVGVLIGNKEILSKKDPFLYGGEMISKVTLNEVNYAPLPWKYEAGTPNIADVIAFGSALNYLKKIGFENIERYEEKLTSYMLEKFKEVPFLKIFGKEELKNRNCVFAFTMENVHPHDLAFFLDKFGIAIRAGHHCAMPLHFQYNLEGSARASLYFYNTFEEVDKFFNAIKKIKEKFG